MEKREKNKNIIVLGIVMAISLSVALNIGNIFGGIGTFFKILNPIILGCMLAVIFNVPMEALSRQLERLSKKVKFLKKEKARNGISLVVTIVIVVLVFAVIMWSIIPDLIESITGFIKNFDNNVNVVTDILDKYDEHLTFINDYVEKIDWNSILKKSGEVAGAFFQSIFTGIPQIGSSLFNLSISVIIAVYVLMDKRRLLSQTERLLEAVFGKKVSSKVTGVTNLFAQTYASFLTGQCVEACILAVLMFITLSICRMPYAGLIMAAVFQFVPYIGTFLACVVGAFLVLFTNPVLTIWFVIVFQIVQFIEGQFIYPRVVGSSVGLPALFTLMAVFLGGKFFGLLGMIFFIPLTSVIYQLLRDMVNNRLSSDKAGNDTTPETGNADTLKADSGSAE
jgi:predicted PurR-regulated permease PerM